MAKSKLPRSTPSVRPQAPPPKLASAAPQQQPPEIQPQSHSNRASVPGASTPPRSASPSSLPDADNAALSSAKKKKKKSKSKAKDSDFIDDHEYDLQAAALGQRPRSPASLAARAQAQAQLLAAASELYRRIEGDPQGIPDDDAYWTSLPAHLRTFIRNALPLGQFPPAAQAALDANPNDPNNRHASTQAMIAVAQQLAQAAHASQRHLQQYPPGSHPYPPLPFDPSIFADLALHPDQPLPLHPHPNSGTNAHVATNGTYTQYSSSPNPPPTQPPLEPLPPPVVLYNNYDDEDDRYDDERDDQDFYSDDEVEAGSVVLDRDGNVLRTRDGVWTQDGIDHALGPNGSAPASDATRSSKNKKKKKKKKNASGANQAVEDDLHDDIEPEAPVAPKPASNNPLPSTNVPSVNRAPNNLPPPSSRAAGKQPMTFNANGKTPARPANGVVAPSNSSKRSASTHVQTSATVNNAKIWSTSSAEERERIKDFWLNLPTKDRQKLVQIEKETLLRKMKEQQRHNCSCAVCGRKRSAIEDELEVLYEAYYHELEDYANHQKRWANSGGTIPPPPGPGPFPGSVALDASGAVIGGDPLSRARGPGRDAKHTHTHHHHGQPRKAPLHPQSEDGYDDEELEDEADYDDDEDDADYDDDEEDEDIDLDRDRTRDDYPKRAPVAPGRRRGTTADHNDLFGLGSSLTVKGGILTVADEMLKNDGRKFLEMMEQLAERRMHRDELTTAELANSEDDEDEDHHDDADEEEDLDDEEDEDEDEVLTDEQRTEEGRKMFQIFAARMFEQRVLQAYREKVAQDRQLQLLRELEEEDTNEKAREARRQKESQKKKDKKKAQREAKEAEKARREAEKAAAEAEARAIAQAQREAELKKQEEIRLKKEAERRAKEEEKAKKDEEKRRRLAEERERELEKERKKKEKEEKIRQEREAQEKAKRDKEEEARKAKEEQERILREKAEKERRAKEEQERRAEVAKKEKEAKAQAQRDAKQANAASQQAPRGSAAATQASPASGRTVASRSPSASAPQTPARGAVKNGSSLPSSPAVGQNAARPAQSTRGLPAQKPASTAVAFTAGAPSQTVPSSSLPAPPQGLPPRPSTAVLTPSGVVSQGSSVSVAANAGLPRPPAGSGAHSNASALGFGSIGPNSSSAGSASSNPSKVSSTNASPKTSQPFAQDKTAFPAGVNLGQPPVYSHAQQQPLAASGSRLSGTFSQQSALEGLRSPTMLNGKPSNPPIGSKSGLDSGSQSPSLGMSSSVGVGAVASNLASLNLSAAPLAPGSGMHLHSGHSNVPQGLGPGVSSQVQAPFSPIGHGPTATDPMRSRTVSLGDTDPMTAFGGIRSNSSLSQRSSYRSNPPVPIGPIGRPKPMDTIHQHDDHHGLIGNGRSSGSASGSGATSPRLPEGILGSSALGGDDDIIDPKPRRTSNTIPIGGGSGGSNIGVGNSFLGGLGGSAGAVGGAFGMSATSPWSSFSGPGAQASPGPLSPGFSNGSSGPGAIGSGVSAASFSLAHGSGGSSALGASTPGSVSGHPDPWSRAQSGWDRARYAFEQPGGNGLGGSAVGSGGIGSIGGGNALHGGGQYHHHTGLNSHAQLGLGGQQSAFGLGAPGAGPRNLFGPPGSGPAGHPGTIASALSPTSPAATRHPGGGHE